MTTLDKLFEEIENDLSITVSNYQEKTYTVPALHSKYLRLFFKQKKILNKLNEELAKLYRDKYHYYTHDYEYTLDNSKEINFHIYSDADYSNLNLKVENQKLLVDCLDRTLKRVQYLSKDISNIMDTIKYINGV